jgi:small subunit ribosomal protein S9
MAKIIDKKTQLPEKKVEAEKAGKYLKGLGRRKASVAQARLFVLEGKKTFGGEISINGRTLENFFGTSELRNIAFSPLKNIEELMAFKATVNVRGGGIRGQAEATRLALARAIVNFDEVYKKPLRDLGFLTRDARVVERKKPGLRKARRAPQFSKR